MKVTRVNIGLKIEQRINELKISKAEFGKMIGIHSQNVKRILDKESIDTDKLIEISEALDYNFFTEYVGSGIISVSGDGIALGNEVNSGMTLDASSTLKNYGDACHEGEPSPMVRTLSESISTLTRELETSQEQKSRLIGIIERITGSKG